MMRMPRISKRGVSGARESDTAPPRVVVIPSLNSPAGVSHLNDTPEMVRCVEVVGSILLDAAWEEALRDRVVCSISFLRHGKAIPDELSVGSYRAVSLF